MCQRTGFSRLISGGQPSWSRPRAPRARSKPRSETKRAVARPYRANPARATSRPDRSRGAPAIEAAVGLDHLLEQGGHGLLGRQKPPVVRLVPALNLELDPIGKIERQLVERYRGPLALDHGDDLGPRRDPGDRRGERRAGPSPCDDLLASEADRVATHEPPLGIVAGGGGHRSGANLVECGLEAIGVRAGVLAGIELDQ